MSAVKELVYDVLDALRMYNMDIEYVAELYNIEVERVQEIAEYYGYDQ
jgi:uncharacterized protein (DUF433 family)